MLTKKQMRLLQLIHNTVEATGVAPSFDEMKDQLNLRSKSGVHRMVVALKEKGFIKRLDNRARALEILPKALNALRAAASGKAPDSLGATAFVPVAVMGRIAAGTPIEALQDIANEVPVPADLLGKGEHYALEVVGDSMTGLGIMDGDTVVIEKRDSARSGDVVVALVDESEATLKRMYQKAGMVELRAANPQYEDRRLPPERVRVQGRLRALLRRY